MNEDEFTKLFKVVMSIQQDVHDIQETMARRDDTDQILNHLDEIHGLLDTDKVERVTQSAELDRHEESLDNHDQRITKLERKLA